MNTVEYLDELRARLRLPSDYALAKALNVTRQMVSQYRSGYRGFGDDVALRVAELMRLPPAKVLAEMAAERAQSDQVRKIWREAAKVIAKAARATAAALLGLLVAAAAILAPVDNAASASQIKALAADSSMQRSLHSWKWLLARLRARLRSWGRALLGVLRKSAKCRLFRGQFPGSAAV